MFGQLTNKLQNLFPFFRSGELSEKNIEKASKDIKLALLSADVNYEVAKLLVERVKSKALGVKVLKGLKPEDQFAKIIYDELVLVMGEKEAALELKKTGLSIILLCGLQGSGKTTTAAKLAYFFKKQGKKVILAACDLQRPAAVEQLQKLSSSINVPVVGPEVSSHVLKVAEKAKEAAEKDKADVLIVDTAGRLHIDDKLMQELLLLKEKLDPQEVLFVASAALGQDSVKTAQKFHEQIGMSGSILTMLDGSARAGAAISINEVTKKPLKFEGVGEKLTDLQIFNPQSMADRILGMGDVINLAKKAEEYIKDDEKAEIEKKIRKADLSYEDYLKQMNMIRKMGPLTSLMKMMPGFSQLKNLEGSEKELKKVESMILSMTSEERTGQDELIYSRRKRIALGSGRTVDDVNRLVKNFKKIKKLLKNMPKGQHNMQQFLGGNIWR